MVGYGAWQPAQLDAPLFDEDASARLAAATVTIVGCGALGGRIARILAEAGVGGLVLVDSTSAGAAPRAETLRDELIARTPRVEVQAVTDRFRPRTALDLVLDAELLIDASRDTPTRYVANDVVEIRDVPLVWGDAAGWEGQAGVAWHARGLDYRDLVPHPAEADDSPDGSAPADTATAPTFAPVIEVVAAVMAAEALKLLAGVGEPLVGRVFHFDARTGTASELAYRRDPGAHPAAAAPHAAPLASVDAHHLAAELASDTPPLLLDVREPWEAELAPLPGALNIPMGQLGDRIGELDTHADTVVFCHHGVRSGRAVELMNRVGFTRARHLRGGIEAWSREIDPTVPRY